MKACVNIKSAVLRSRVPVNLAHFVCFAGQLTDTPARLAGVDLLPAGSFDSLMAVDMSSSLSNALDVQLPNTLVFDYPSVSSMAQHVFTLLASARQGSAFDDTRDLGVPSFLPQLTGRDMPHRMLTSLSIATRLPAGLGDGYSQLGPHSVDSIGLVPFSRWDLAKSEVTTHLGL